MSFDKELLFKPRLPEDDVEVPGVGTVRVRSLSRAEVMLLQKMAQDGEDPAAVERKMLSIALVDPALTEAEVGRWQRASIAGELEPVSDKVTALSGLDDDAAKAAYKEFEADPGSEFRLLPGAETVDDGGAAEGAAQ